MTTNPAPLTDAEIGKWIVLVTLTEPEKLPRRTTAQYLGCTDETTVPEYVFSLRPLAGTTRIRKSDVLNWHESAEARPKLRSIAR